MDQAAMTYFRNGVQHLLANDPPNAAANFEYVATQFPGAADECDLWRALAATRDRASGADIDSAHRAIRTFGHLVARLDGVDETLLSGRFRIPYCDMDWAMRTRDDLICAKAMLELEAGHHQRALDELGEIPDTAARTFFVALVHHHAQRWTDVIDQAGALLGADDQDDSSRQLAQTLLGAAYAHLGNYPAALAKLHAATSTPGMIGPAAEAWRLYGLVKRAEGDEAEAQSAFSHAQTWHWDKSSVTEYMNDPSKKLRVTTAEAIRRRTDPFDPATEPDLKAEAAAAREDERSKALVEAELKLSEQIGMGAVKKQVRSLRAQVAHAQELKRRGLPAPGSALHTAFTGPPGTGKTTIAEIVAKILYGLGVCKTGTFVAASRKDMVGEHLGSSAPKTDALVDTALGGVLFIDEAYTLIQTGLSGGDAFGKEAVDTLLARMENDRDELVVIIAGYDEEIDRFLAANEGLSSRFARRVQFESYSPEEIGEIFALVAKRRGGSAEPAAVETVVVETRSRLMHRVAGKDYLLLDKVGNGRFARNLVEKAEEHRSIRLDDADYSLLSDKEMTTIVEADAAEAIEEVISWEIKE